MRYDQKLRRLLDYGNEHDEDTRVPVKAFQDMLRRFDQGYPTTERQENFVSSIYERVFDEPAYENTWSRGLVPLGKPVATPDVLRKLPLKPPGRR